MAHGLQKLNAEAVMHEGNEQRNKIRLWLGFTFVVSILLLVILHDSLKGFWWGDFITRVIDAVAIAAVIGFALEEALLREFGRDVFFASVGYVLPNELRPEMRWLCQLNEMCTQDVMVCRITPIGDSVKFHVHRTQVVKNIGQHKLELNVGLGIDQWFRSEAESRIMKFAFITEGQNWSHAGEPKRSPFGMNLPDGTPPVLLEKGKEVTIVSEFEEVYPRNGYFFMHMKYATSGARVTVNCPDDLGVYVDFANREGKTALQIGYDYVCPFTLLPYQRTAVRFWDKKQGAAWQGVQTISN
jgi:hypothetical protein